MNWVIFWAAIAGFNLCSALDFAVEGHAWRALLSLIFAALGLNWARDEAQKSQVRP